ncbi:hypothetical protein CTI12_AA212350 [Artemisia annua]|uniref:Uncharacterized protein n=1 Tax=Artemisia annua TaxID=35608 RepID=A0A2U1NYZ4_ARTAN|nr:hypothetical protein CTI12_AA212350 [Artemisia annua]
MLSCLLLSRFLVLLPKLLLHLRIGWNSLCRYMGHNRDGEEAPSALSRAFIEKEQLNEQQKKNEEKKVEPVKWLLFAEQPTMTKKQKVSMDALRIMLYFLTVITRTHKHVSPLCTLIHTIMNCLLWSCLLGYGECEC